jgi:hypothetical protein
MFVHASHVVIAKQKPPVSIIRLHSFFIYAINIFHRHAMELKGADLEEGFAYADA